VLNQGPLSANGQALGFGLEGVTNTKSQVILENNTILLERIGENTLLESGESQVNYTSHGNLIVWQKPREISGGGIFILRTGKRLGLGLFQ